MGDLPDHYEAELQANKATANGGMKDGVDDEGGGGGGRPMMDSVDGIGGTMDGGGGGMDGLEGVGKKKEDGPMKEKKEEDDGPMKEKKEEDPGRTPTSAPSSFVTKRRKKEPKKVDGKGGKKEESGKEDKEKGAEEDPNETALSFDLSGERLKEAWEMEEDENEEESENGDEVKKAEEEPSLDLSDVPPEDASKVVGTELYEKVFEHVDAAYELLKQGGRIEILFSSIGTSGIFTNGRYSIGVPNGELVGLITLEARPSEMVRIAPVDVFPEHQGRVSKSLRKGEYCEKDEDLHKAIVRLSLKLHSIEGAAAPLLSSAQFDTLQEAVQGYPTGAEMLANAPKAEPMETLQQLMDASSGIHVARHNEKVLEGNKIRKRLRPAEFTGETEVEMVEIPVPLVPRVVAPTPVPSKLPSRGIADDQPSPIAAPPRTARAAHAKKSIVALSAVTPITPVPSSLPSRGIASDEPSSITAASNERAAAETKSSVYTRLKRPTILETTSTSAASTPDNIVLSPTAVPLVPLPPSSPLTPIFNRLDSSAPRIDETGEQRVEMDGIEGPSVNANGEGEENGNRTMRDEYDSERTDEDYDRDMEEDMDGSIDQMENAMGREIWMFIRFFGKSRYAVWRHVQRFIPNLVSGKMAVHVAISDQNAKERGGVSRHVDVLIGSGSHMGTLRIVAMGDQLMTSSQHEGESSAHFTKASTELSRDALEFINGTMTVSIVEGQDERDQNETGDSTQYESAIDDSFEPRSHNGITHDGRNGSTVGRGSAHFDIPDDFDVSARSSHSTVPIRKRRLSEDEDDDQPPKKRGDLVRELKETKEKLERLQEVTAAERIQKVVEERKRKTLEARLVVEQRRKREARIECVTLRRAAANRRAAPAAAAAPPAAAPVAVVAQPAPVAAPAAAAAQPAPVVASDQEMIMECTKDYFLEYLDKAPVLIPKVSNGRQADADLYRLYNSASRTVGIRKKRVMGAANLAVYRMTPALAADPTMSETIEELSDLLEAIDDLVTMEGMIYEFALDINDDHRRTGVVAAPSKKQKKEAKAFKKLAEKQMVLLKRLETCSQSLPR